MKRSAKSLRRGQLPESLPRCCYQLLTRSARIFSNALVTGSFPEA